MTAMAGRWPLFIQIVAIDAILMSPSFAEIRYFPLFLLVAHGANTDPIGTMLFMVKLHTFLEINNSPGKGGR